MWLRSRFAGCGTACVALTRVTFSKDIAIFDGENGKDWPSAVELSKMGNSKGDLAIRGYLKQVRGKADELLEAYRASYIEGGLYEELCKWFDERMEGVPLTWEGMARAARQLQFTFSVLRVVACGQRAPMPTCVRTQPHVNELCVCMMTTCDACMRRCARLRYTHVHSSCWVKLGMMNVIDVWLVLCSHCQLCVHGLCMCADMCVNLIVMM